MSHGHGSHRGRHGDSALAWAVVVLVVLALARLVAALIGSRRPR